MSRLRAAALSLALLPIAASAFADGGQIALHASAGGCTVTLFTGPAPLLGRPDDLSLLVQETATGALLDDAIVTGKLVSTTRRSLGTGGGEAARSAAVKADTFSFAKPGAGSALYQAGSGPAAAGRYSLDLSVNASGCGPAPVSFHTFLEVAGDQGRSHAVLLGLLAPVGVVLLFLWNQQLKRRRGLARRVQAA